MDCALAQRIAVIRPREARTVTSRSRFQEPRARILRTRGGETMLGAEYVDAVGSYRGFWHGVGCCDI